MHIYSYSERESDRESNRERERPHSPGTHALLLGGARYGSLGVQQLTNSDANVSAAKGPGSLKYS